MTDKERSTGRQPLDQAIDEVLRELAGADRTVNVRARVLNRLAGHGAPARSSLRLRWQLRWAVPAIGVAAVAIVAVITAALLVRGPSPSISDGKIAASGETSVKGSVPFPLGQPSDRLPPRAPTESSLAAGAAAIAAARVQAVGGLTRRPGITSRAVHAGSAADGVAAEGAAVEGDAPAIAVEPLTMDPLVNPAPVHVPAIEIDPIVVPDIKIQMIEIKPIDVGSTPRPPDQGKPPQR